MKTRFLWLAAATFISSISSALAANSSSVYFSNVGAKGSGSCSAISGSFPLQATYATSSSGNTYYLNILIQVTGSNGVTSQQYLTDVLSQNGTYTEYDPNLFATFNAIPGTYTGPISVSSTALILGNSTTPVTLTSGSCVITLAVIAVASPN